MASAAASVPAESDLLCEACGYVLNGLPGDGNCPECGVPASQSAPARRGPPAWEQRGFFPARFLATTYEVLFHPYRFYRSLDARAGRRKSRVFAIIHMGLASLLFGLAECVHIQRFFDLSAIKGLDLRRAPDFILGTVLLAAITFVMFAITTPIAARLTTWEAAYRGLRLPLRVVRRGLDYHAAHYLPVVALAAATIIGYRWLLDRNIHTPITDLDYLYVVCGEVIIGAAYLFWTYWIGMRNMMYANG